MKNLISESKQKLYHAGWKDAPYYHGKLTLQKVIDNKTHTIEIDSDRPHLINTWRVKDPSTVITSGIIGNFVGGKGRRKATKVDWFMKNDNIRKYLK